MHLPWWVAARQGFLLSVTVMSDSSVRLLTFTSSIMRQHQSDVKDKFVRTGWIGPSNWDEQVLYNGLVDMSNVMRQRRADLGMSQAELADTAGIGVRQIRRYEAGEQQPVLSVAVAIADALKISVGELAGTTTDQLDLTGDWYAGWQTWREGQEALAVQSVRMSQRGNDIEVQTITHGLSETGYHWQGAFRLWDNEVLLGWYAATEGSVRSKGTMYFILHPHGIHMRGRWVGLGYDDKIMTGWSSMARTDEDTRYVIEKLKESNNEHTG